MTEKRLTGAALNKRVEYGCRKLLAEYGLPMEHYKLKEIDKYDLGHDMQPIMTVTFVHENGLEVRVNEIYPSDDGFFNQVGHNYGRLAY